MEQLSPRTVDLDAMAVGEDHAADNQSNQIGGIKDCSSSLPAFQGSERCKQVLPNLWFTCVERRWGDLEKSLAVEGIDTLELQRRADISQHAAQALLNPEHVELAPQDKVFFHVNALVTCKEKQIRLPRTSIGQVTEVTDDGSVRVEVLHPKGACQSEILTCPAVLKKIDLDDAQTAEPKSEAALRYRVYIFLQSLERLHLLPVASNQGFGPLASLVDGFRGLCALGLPSAATVKVYADGGTFSKMRNAFPSETKAWQQDGTTAVGWAVDENEILTAKSPAGKKMAENELAFSSQFSQPIEFGRELKWCIQNTFCAANFVAAGPYSWVNQDRPLLLAGEELAKAAIPFDSVWQFPVTCEPLSKEFESIAQAAQKELIELIVNYGMHTIHQVEGQPQPKLQRVAYAEGNLALAAHQLEFDRPIVIVSFCPQNTPEGVGKCSELPKHGGIQAAWLERKSIEDIPNWLETLPRQDSKGKVVIVYFEKSTTSTNIQGLAQAATLPNGYEGASFGSALQVQRKPFFSFWDLPGEGTALPQGVATTPGDRVVLDVHENGRVDTYALNETSATPMPAHEGLDRMLDVTDALNPHGTRKTYTHKPSELKPPELGLTGVEGLYSVQGAKVIEAFLRDAKNLHNKAQSREALILARYYIETWNMAEDYRNDMALQLLKELLKVKKWKF